MENVQTLCLEISEREVELTIIALFAQVSRLLGAIGNDGDVEQPAKDLALLIRLVGRIGTTANEVGLIDLDSISEFKKGLNSDD